jgi:hypothetical protein
MGRCTLLYLGEKEDLIVEQSRLHSLAAKQILKKIENPHLRHSECHPPIDHYRLGSEIVCNIVDSMPS